MSENFTADDVPERTKETAKNWFVKIGDVKELVPRFYGKFSLRKSIVLILNFTFYQLFITQLTKRNK